MGPVVAGTPSAHESVAGPGGEWTGHILYVRNAAGTRRLDPDTLIFGSSCKTLVDPLLRDQPKALDGFPSFPNGQNSGTCQENSRLNICNLLRELQNLDERGSESPTRPKMNERGHEERKEGNFDNLENEQNKGTCQQNLDLEKLDNCEDGPKLGVCTCTSGRELGRRADGGPREENLKCGGCEIGKDQNKEDSEPRTRTEKGAARKRTEKEKHWQTQGKAQLMFPEGGQHHARLMRRRVRIKMKSIGQLMPSSAGYQSTSNNIQ